MSPCLLVCLSPCLIALWLYLLFLHGLGTRDLWNSHEARAAMNAASILDGSSLIPRLHDDRLELQKPPLYYWMVVLGASVNGAVDAWTTRLPSAFCGILCVVIVAELGRRVGRRTEGLLAAFFLATAVHFTWLARVARIDIPLTLTTTLALAGYYLADREAGRKRLAWLLVAYLSLALSLLLKGPIGVVLVASVMGLFLLLEGRLPALWKVRAWARLFHDFGIWWGIPLLLGLSLPWFFLANRETDGEFFRVFFWLHNVERGLGGSRLRGHPWWLYGPRFFADFAPWSVLFPFALTWFLRQHRWRLDREARFGLAWFIAMLVVLSCVRYKRADYLVPAYPGVALFLACVLRQWQPFLLTRLVPVVLFVSGIGWWVRVEFVLPSQEPQLEQRSFAMRIRDEVPVPQPVLLFQTEAHALAFHLGKPVRTVVHWHELQALLKEGSHYLVMPVRQTRIWREQLTGIELDEVARNREGHEKPMVLFRSRPDLCKTKEVPSMTSR